MKRKAELCSVRCLIAEKLDREGALCPLKVYEVRKERGAPYSAFRFIENVVC